MKKTNPFCLSNVALLLMLLLGTSCVPQKKMLYLQGAEVLQDSPQYIGDDEFELTIQPDDQLSIAIASKDEELIAPFNSKTYIGMGNRSPSASSQSGLSYFHVDNRGMIDFPILGKLHVKGKNREEVEDLIEKLLIEGNHIKDPQVSVKIMSFKINVLGEVRSPGVQQLTGERLTILEAIGMAGDLLPTAKRKNVMVLREENGYRHTYHVDLTSSKDVLNSPVYYLQQNDVIYVEPNKSIGVRGSSTLTTITTFGGLIAMVLSIASIIISASN